MGNVFTQVKRLQAPFEFSLRFTSLLLGAAHDLLVKAHETYTLPQLAKNATMAGGQLFYKRHSPC